ncbi:MAG: hypothetical protein K2M73_07440 [Lachnospiraceae bacterium]|nr:hypothetical protein [Lachnospiraceae bacterium]
MEKTNNDKLDNNKLDNNELFPDIEFLEDIEFENDITMLENSQDKKKRSASGKGSRKKKKNQKSKFKKILFIYAVALLIVTVGVWIFFYSFIDGYEKGMSYHKIAEIAEDINKNLDSYLANITAGNEFEDNSYAVNYIRSLITGKEIEYKEAKENTTVNPVYELLVEDKAFAKVSLKQDGTIKHGFKKWTISEIDLVDYLPTTATISILALEGSTVYVNGIEVNDTYITEKGVSVDLLSNVEQYLDVVPKITKYEINGLFETPTVVVKDSTGNEMDVSVDGGTYTAVTNSDSSLEDEFMQYVQDVTYAYARNFANLGKSIFNYVRPGSDLYESINSATTYFYPDSKISGTEFTSREITDFVKYSEDCFACHVKYEYTIYFTNYSTDKDVSVVDMIWIFVEHDGLWYLTDTKYYQ